MCNEYLQESEKKKNSNHKSENFKIQVEENNINH